MPYLEIRSGTDHNGQRASVRRLSTGQHVAVVVVPPKSTAFVSHAEALSADLETTARQLIDSAARYSEDGFKDWARPSIFRPLGQAFRAYRNAGVDQRCERASTLVDIATPRFTTKPGDPDPRAPFRAELRSRVFGSKAATALQMALENYEIGAAVAEGGEALAIACGWTSDLYGRLIDGFARQNLARRLADQHQHRLKPDAVHILRDGVDHDAANRAAERFMDSHRAAVAEIDAVEAMLGGVVDFVAVTMDTDRGAAFDALMAE